MPCSACFIISLFVIANSFNCFLTLSWNKSWTLSPWQWFGKQSFWDWIFPLACVAGVWKGRGFEHETSREGEGKRGTPSSSILPRAQNPLSLSFRTPATQANFFFEGIFLVWVLEFVIVNHLGIPGFISFLVTSGFPSQLTILIWILAL